MKKGDKVIVIATDKTTCLGRVQEVTRDGTAFKVGIMPNAGSDGLEFTFVLGFLGPPDARGWWEGGPIQAGYRRRFYCALVPEALADESC